MYYEDGEKIMSDGLIYTTEKKKSIIFINMNE